MMIMICGKFVMIAKSFYPDCRTIFFIVWLYFQLILVSVGQKPCWQIDTLVKSILPRPLFVIDLLLCILLFVQNCLCVVWELNLLPSSSGTLLLFIYWTDWARGAVYGWSRDWGGGARHNMSLFAHRGLSSAVLFAVYAGNGMLCSEYQARQYSPSDPCIPWGGGKNNQPQTG